eukprot:CAMPEP_0195288756 /NCGR_PEP_ID=MMETSP0707-20130614/5291_1 /TAXON_ID=33640 /ORGANISM="Asterionellopsis glacialis, Strain CCMP134" /LENGTH=840 /DNA_ID=CAMNT_0040348657 /DNA_START=176 /DNA_END=2695 /DNA_ORIENTATION=+
MSINMGTSNDSIPIRVLVANTGVCYNITLHSSELTVSNIRRHLAAVVPPSDQILLLGPPFKVPKDATLQSEEVLTSLRLGDEEDSLVTAAQHKDDTSSTTATSANSKQILSTTERSGARRLFLFSKQALSESAPDPPPCELQPMNLNLPTEPGPSPLQSMLKDNANTNTSSQVSQPASSPLHQALEVYERQFMLHLCRGRALADGADLRLSSCRTCVSEQAVMARALRAAVSNLSDHFNGATRTRSEFTATFQEKTAAHSTLLQKFESHLSTLQSMTLHPSLVSVARASGRVMETLLDTVPVDRERAWATQCSTSHQRLITLFGELDTAFSQLGTQASREEEARQDLLAEEEIKELWTDIEGTAQQIRDKQAQKLERLTADHGEVVKLIMSAISQGSAQAAFSPLEDMSKASADILPSMESDDAVLQQLMQKVAHAKTRAMKRMKRRLREVSVSQSSIQRVLSNLTVLREALSQQCDNMIHLEHVSELPASYRSFLSELRRRRAYGAAVTSTSTAMMDRLATLRADEVKNREKFLRGAGRHLMPPFFEILAPTLATPPPLFTPQMPGMIELDTLPDVGLSGDSSVVPGTSSDAQMEGNASAQGGGVSTASSLTTESQPPQQATEKENKPETIIETSATDNMDQATTDQLIVSADENSGNDLIVEPSDHAGAAADAERKTLEYENAVLRQALESMGGKTPRAYIEEARAQQSSSEPLKTGATTGNEESELITLQKELEKAKEESRAANEALVASKKLTDKISHSSFEVGDVGLFMPTGRGQGGRTYLAVHTNCPHRYLSTDSVKGEPDFVLGRIIYQEELVAGEVGSDANPYGLHVGTKFW